MKFSVVIPLYNGAGTIKRTLDSVLAQTYKDFEVVLVNDESPDNVRGVVKQYIVDHSTVDIKYFEQKNKGLGGARNTAIKHASGEIIAILDQDDVWYHNKLERVAQIYNLMPDIDIVCHDLHLLKNEKIDGEIICGTTSNDIYRYLLFQSNCLSTAAVTFKKVLTKTSGYFSEDKEKFHFSEDYDLWLKFARRGHKFYFLHESLGGYSLHDNNCSKNNIERMLKSGLNVVHQHFQELTNRRTLDYFRYVRRKSRLYYQASCLYRKVSLKRTIVNLVRAITHDPFMLLFIIRRFSLRGSK